MKLRINRKMSDTIWRGTEAVSSYFLAFDLIGDKGVGVDFQLLVTEEEYNSCEVNQVIEVNLKS